MAVVSAAAAVLVPALTGCSAIDKAIHHSSTTASATAAATATCTAVGDGSMAGQLTGLRNDAKVARQQPVSGVATDLPAGDKAWLVIYPVLAHAYWPQEGPLKIDAEGCFQSTAVFGSTSTKNNGEHFVLRLVITPAAATVRFRAFLANPAKGWSKLPAGTQTLAKVTVIRA